MKARAGVLTAAEIEGPMPTASGGSMFNLSEGATWSFIWFMVALILLFVL